MQTNYINPVVLILLVVLVLFTVFAIFYIYITAKSKERMALIEKGMNPNMAKSDFWIQIGLMFGGFFFGLMISEILPGKFGTYGPPLGITIAGTGLVVYNIMRKK